MSKKRLHSALSHESISVNIYKAYIDLEQLSLVVWPLLFLITAVLWCWEKVTCLRDMCRLFIEYYGVCVICVAFGAAFCNIFHP